MEEIRNAPRTLGHHACPRGLTESADAPELGDAQMPLRLVIPPVTPGLSDAMEALLARIGRRENVTLVLNDWGTLARCAARKREGRLCAALCLGALLNTQDTDPVLYAWTQPQPDRTVLDEHGVTCLRWAPPPETLTEHWRCPSALHLTPLLRSLGVEEAELCRQAIEPPLEMPGLRTHRLPYEILTVQPCGGDCAHCGGTELVRCGRRFRWDRNMLVGE